MCRGRLCCAAGGEAANRGRERVHLQLEGGREQGNCTPVQRAGGERMEGLCLQKISSIQDMYSKTSVARVQGKGGFVLCAKAKV